MTTFDWPTIGASLATVLTAIGAKMGVDKVRGGNGSALKEKVEAHIKDDDDKFAAMTQALKEVVATATDSKVELVREIGGVAQSVARVEGQLVLIVQALKKD